MRRLLILAAVVLAGCANYQPKPITPARLAQSFEVRSLSSDALRSYLSNQLGHKIEPWPLPRWNREMLTLAAYYYSPTLDIARAQWGTSKASIEVADAIPNPVFQLPFSYTTNNHGPGRPYTTGPALDIPIETAHKRGYRVDQASELSEAARLNIANEAWKVHSAVRNALLNLFSVQKRIGFLSQKVTDQQQILDMLRTRLKVGEVAEPDVNQALLAFNRARADLAAARSTLLDAHTRLASIIGLPTSALESAQLNLDEFERIDAAPPPVAARRAAIFHRADLLGSLAEYEATQSALQLEIAKQYPDVHIGPGYTYDVGANKIDFGLSGITLPIFDQNQGGIAQAEAKRKEAAARTAALQDTIINDLHHALARYLASFDALRLSKVRLSTARILMNSQAASFAAGTADRLTRTQASEDYLNSAIDHLNDVVAAHQAAGALEDTMQQSLSPIVSNGALTGKEISR